MKLNPKYGSLLLVFLLTSLIPYGSFGDVGSCARYKINLVFEDGDSLTCYVQLCSYEANLKDLNEDEILQRMKVSDSVTVYKRIQTISYPEAGTYYGFKYSAAADEDRVRVDVDRITKISKLAVMRCEHGNFGDDDSYLINFTSQIIEGLSQKEIDLLQTKPYSQIVIESPPESYDIDVCLSYREDIDEEQLEEVCQLYLENEAELPAEEFWHLQKEYYSETVEKLRSMEIIVIHIYGYN